MPILSDSQVHAARTAAAHLCNATRRATSFAFAVRGSEIAHLQQHGFAVVKDFLDAAEFNAIRCIKVHR